jgi:hypothetical protein
MLCFLCFIPFSLLRSDGVVGGVRSLPRRGTSVPQSRRHAPGPTTVGFSQSCCYRRSSRLKGARAGLLELLLLGITRASHCASFACDLRICGHRQHRAVSICRTRPVCSTWPHGGSPRPALETQTRSLSDRASVVLHCRILSSKSLDDGYLQLVPLIRPLPKYALCLCFATSFGFCASLSCLSRQLCSFAMLKSNILSSELGLLSQLPVHQSCF